MSTVAIIQARMRSTRLPGKILADLGGKPALEWVIQAAQAIPGVDKVVIATSLQQDDDVVADWCAARKVDCHRGSEDDVLGRFYGAARNANANIVLRLTADCPFLDPQVCGAVLYRLQSATADYASNCDPATWPDGLDCEAFTIKALEDAHNNARRKSCREHVTPYIRQNRHRFNVVALTCPIPGLWNERWTLDEPSDLEFLRAVASRLGKPGPVSYLDVLAVLDANPNLRSINRQITRNEGFTASLSSEPLHADYDYTASNQLRDRACKVIPLGSQTFSKCHIQYPQDNAPLFLTHGDGGRVWDVDGNEYVDLVCGLLPVVLGYRDPDVDAAIREQLACGITLSLPSPLETRLAEMLIDIIPCAQSVRFGKNGTDATSAAVRLARAFTGRDKIMVCGYHGWQDWYIGSTSRDKGVPKAVRDLTFPVAFNDLDAVRSLLAQHPGEFAALLMEPMNATDPQAGYLDSLKELLHAHGALFMFDEIITGFRYALGGAQSYFNVTPDLASFGKAMGNGMPISAIVGREDIMAEMEEIFFSGTFGGEALSLAASIAVIDKMKREPVIERLWQTGEFLSRESQGLFARHGLADVLSLCGKAPWKILAVKDHPKARKEAIKTCLAQAMFKRGTLLLASHNVCYAHGAADLSRVLKAYDESLAHVASELETDRLEERLGIPPIMPVFRVR